jgi:hypothetical protein
MRKLVFAAAAVAALGFAMPAFAVDSASHVSATTVKHPSAPDWQHHYAKRCHWAKRKIYRHHRVYIKRVRVCR